MGLWQDLQRYRTPMLLGVGGIVAYSAFQRARTETAAAAAPIVGAVPPSGLSPEAALAAQAAAYQAGAGMGLQGAQIGLSVADRSLDLAGIATMGAQAVSGDLVGLASNLGSYLGSATETITGVIPDLAAAAQPAAPTPPAADTDTAYWASTSPGTASVFLVDPNTGAVTGSRTYKFAGGRVMVRRASKYGPTAWRVAEGALTGWSLIPGQTTTLVRVSPM